MIFPFFLPNICELWGIGSVLKVYGAQTDSNNKITNFLTSDVTSSIELWLSINNKFITDIYHDIYELLKYNEVFGWTTEDEDRLLLYSNRLQPRSTGMYT